MEIHKESLESGIAQLESPLTVWRHKMFLKFLFTSLLTMVLPVLCLGMQTEEKASELSARDLWKGVREENIQLVEAALAAGVDVNATNEYGATALMFAADRGNEAIANALLKAGADPSIQDKFYNSTPIAWANMKNHKNLVLAMLATAPPETDKYLLTAIDGGDADWARKILEQCKPSEAGLLKARNAAIRKSKEKLYEDLPKLFEKFNLPEYVVPKPLTSDELKPLIGTYQGDQFNAHVQLQGEKLKMGFSPDSLVELEFLGGYQFAMTGAEVSFLVTNNRVEHLTIESNAGKFTLKPTGDSEKMKEEKNNSDSDKASGEKKSDDDKEKERATSESTDRKSKTKKTEFGPSSELSLKADLAISSANWPSFRGNGARGVADGQHPPTQWKVEKDEAENQNVNWIAEVPGLGLSCPTIWEDNLYLTSAVSEEGDKELKIGLYGDVDSVKEDVVYDFYVYCFDKKSGELNWARKANSTKPAVKRHAKSSHANPTIATNGESVVAFFGSEGLFCYSKSGELKWKKDLGVLDSGWFYDASYQWGFGASPIIFDNKVIIQCDIQESSFVAAFALEDGKELWRTDRVEIPSWSSPTVHQFGELPMLLTHATKAARGYDARDGKLLWSLAKHSEIVVPTPFVAHDLIFVASGYSPIQPIVAVRPTARGEIDLPKGETSSEAVAWSTLRHGPYMPTPIVYGDYLYVCSNSGVLACYFATTGEEVYRKRMTAKGGGLAFTASPIAADGHLYLASEDGRVLVVKAGPEYELSETNETGGNILATPAISDGSLYVRTQNKLISVGKKSTSN